ncbi:MAG TPA: hypothetical protein VFB06_28885 [Streptosporangiaceae bacterium]|nr:hypothetical protein [Streptosporangiaceae bacterium]
MAGLSRRTHAARPQRSADGRGRLLLAFTAVLAVAAPGCLITGCSSPPATAEGSGAAASAPRVAAARAGTASTRGLRKHSSPVAMSLMTEAAKAAVITSYQGEEVDSRWDSGGGTLLVSDIWHVSGGQTWVQTQAAGSGVSAQTYESTDPDGGSPEGVLGVTTTLVGLLENHYVVAYAGAASADNRPAQVVEAWRGDGSLAALFYLDQATKLPLERRVYDAQAHVINESFFINVQIGKPVSQPRPRALGAAQGQQQKNQQQKNQQAAAWTVPIPPAKLGAFARSGWRVVPVLPDGLTLFTGAQTTAAEPVLDLGYSDGLYVVSLFEQRGKLATKLAGWQRTTVGGRIVYAAGSAQRSLTWSGGGMVYTLIADAPAPTVAAVVDALPYDKPPGFWKRMSRGLARLASLANPFH